MYDKIHKIKNFNKIRNEEKKQVAMKQKAVALLCFANLYRHVEQSAARYP